MWIGKAAEGYPLNVRYLNLVYTVYIVILNYYIYKNSKPVRIFENR